MRRDKILKLSATDLKEVKIHLIFNLQPNSPVHLTKVGQLIHIDLVGYLNSTDSILFLL